MLHAHTQRKRPKCHKCGMLMAGHKRRSGMILCPGTDDEYEGSTISAEDVLQAGASGSGTAVERDSTPDSSLPSPPASPGPKPNNGLGSPERPTTPTFKVPQDKSIWHWRNPNWESPPRTTVTRRSPRSLVGFLNGSLVPTELASNTNDQRTELNSVAANTDEKENVPTYRLPASYPNPANLQTPLDYEDMFSNPGRVPSPLYAAEGPIISGGAQYGYGEEEEEESSRPYGPDRELEPEEYGSQISSDAFDSIESLFRIIRAPRRDVPAITRAASRRGKYVAIVPTPPSTQYSRGAFDDVEDTVWLAIGDHPQAVHEAASMGERSMSNVGSMQSSSGSTIRSAGVGFLQVLFAGVVGGLAVTAVLALM
ncbi:hypothetical protein CONPUDRAFT_139634 [Coniophora puteana RWD-64-598 SS2]|uniref:Uncharacterized protein n=1 Tax=Coniophora puteana (strain RWD-64-598) TaxID=741705 RepID=A0A5M3MBK9_CONPW|nr:uncharacterized protein CONPUDRAFT_139634 [Coniophora puteana RWD-64-598 SS2]EIW76200.1 hypothetical protein CONPUDRAFT_139634 [Coniophora puteana RWD-64-598 SS2]